jgi:transglutaminase-like putative cysteine protease
VPPSTAHVRCNLAFTAARPSILALAVAIADRAGPRSDERLVVTHDDAGPLLVDELADGSGGRIHVVRCPPGPFRVEYGASVEPVVAGDRVTDDIVENDIHPDDIVALRQSRYCPSDELEGFASATFDTSGEHHHLAHEIAEWVFHRIRYEPGSSGPTHTAIDTLLESRGVCRDFAHLTVTLCRASGIPARLASVYAPGLSPMDFHAVAEVRTEHGWEVLDATRLAPRQTLVRIATGRDAADTAFATTLEGDLALDTAEVMAVVDGDLPLDGHTSVVALA